MIKKMYGLSNKKDVNEHFARQECRRTLLSRQHEVDQQADVDLQGIDGSPMLHHSMASQAQRDNVFSLPLYLFCYAHDPAIKVSDRCVWPPHTYMSSSRILCHA